MVRQIKRFDVARKKNQNLLQSHLQKSEEVIHFSSSKSMLANIPRSIFEHLHNLLIFKIMKKRRLPLQSGRKTDGAVAKSWCGKVLRLIIHSYTAQPFLPGRPSPLTPMNLWLVKTFYARFYACRRCLRPQPRGQIENARRRKSSHANVCSTVPGWSSWARRPISWPWSEATPAPRPWSSRPPASPTPWLCPAAAGPACSSPSSFPVGRSGKNLQSFLCEVCVLVQKKQKTSVKSTDSVWFRAG